MMPRLTALLGFRQFPPQHAWNPERPLNAQGQCDAAQGLRLAARQSAAKLRRRTQRSECNHKGSPAPLASRQNLARAAAIGSKRKPETLCGEDVRLRRDRRSQDRAHRYFYALDGT